VDRRLKKIERILAVQKRLHQLAEWRLAELDREKAELIDGQKALVAALNHDAQLQGLFVEAMARRLSALARETDRVNQARNAQFRRLVEEGLRLKRTERMTAGVRRDYRTSQSKQGFENLLETLARTDNASLP